MRRARYPIGRLGLLTLAIGFLAALPTLRSGAPALGAEDLFRSMGVERSTNPGLSPDLALPTLAGKTVHIKDFRGNVVLLGFFSTT
jgi:hypothetical protein